MPMAAFAGDRPWYWDGAGAVDLEDVVEVPVFRGEATQGLPTVEVLVPSTEADKPGKRMLAGVEMGSDANRMPKSMAKGLGLEVRELNKSGRGAKKQSGSPKGKTLVAVVPELRVGAAVFKDVRFVLTGSSMVLSFLTVDEVAVALLPSRGVLQMVAAANGASLLEAVATPIQAEWGRTGPFHVNGSKKYHWGPQLFAPGRLGGHEVQVAISTQNAGSDTQIQLGPNHLSAAKSEGERGGVPWAMGDIVFGGLELTGRRLVFGAPSNYLKNEALVGYTDLVNVDIALNASTAMFAMKQVDAPKWSTPDELLLEIARDEFDAGAEKQDETESPATESAEATESNSDPKEASRQRAYASALNLAGKGEKSLGHLREAVEADPESCSAHLDLADQLLTVGKAKEALQPATQAGELWDKWSRQDLVTRMRVQDKKTVSEEVYQTVQEGKCHKAWSLVARSQLAMNNHQALASIQREHSDLDRDLPLVVGASLLVQNNARSHGYIREALNLSGRADKDVRHLLGLSAASEGNAAVAERQLQWFIEQAETLTLTDTLGMIHTARLIGGNGGVDRLVAALVKKRAWSVGAWLAFGYRALETGNDVALDLYQAQSPAVFKRAGIQQFGYANLACQMSLDTAISGDSETAKEALASATAAPDADSDCFAASALLASINGDHAGVKGATTSLKRRGSVALIGLFDAIAPIPPALPVEPEE